MKKLSSEMLKRELDELAAFKPNGFPFVSLYLNAQADQHGRDNFQPFVRKEFASRAKTFPIDSAERAGFERAAARIRKYLENELRASANGLAIFAGTGADEFFQAIELDAPIQANELHVSASPHLYPLARLLDQYPRHVALVADTDAARLYVFDLGSVKSSQEIDNSHVGFAPDGVRTQLRYRRRVENNNLLHAKEVAQLLERVVREESAERIVVAGDEVIIPLLREQFPAHLANKVIDVLRLDIRTPEHEILKATMDALREDNIQTDAEKVRDLLDKSSAGGLAVTGLGKALNALTRGQVDELLLSASLDEIRIDEDRRAGEVYAPPEDVAASTIRNQINGEEELTPEVIANALISLAHSTGAAVTFIEDAALLAGAGGVGAFLRYRF